MVLAHPASDERAFKDLRGLTRRGRRLLVSAGIVALAFFAALILIVTYGSAHDQSVAILIGDYVVTLGIAVPGLTLFMLRLYTDRSMRRGNAMIFSKRAKLGLVSISWVVLLIVVVLLFV